MWLLNKHQLLELSQCKYCMMNHRVSKFFVNLIFKNIYLNSYKDSIRMLQNFHIVVFKMCRCFHEKKFCSNLPKLRWQNLKVRNRCSFSRDFSSHSLTFVASMTSTLPIANFVQHSWELSRKKKVLNQTLKPRKSLHGFHFTKNHEISFKIG